MMHRLPLAAALGALSVLASARDAAAWTSLDPSNPPRWAQMPVTYFVNRSTVPSVIAGTAIARIDAGFASWSNPACTEWQTQNLGDTTDSYDYNDGQNVIRWISGSWPSELGDVDSVIGVTMPVWNNGESVIFDADMVFNNVGFCWDNSGSSDCVDTQSIATHEEGHFLGLDHSSVPSATMVAFYGGGNALRSLDGDDIEGVCALYPVGGTSATTTGTGTGGSTCESCFDGSSSGTCAPAYDECARSAPCRTFAGCISDCSDDACIDGCISSNRAGAELYIGMIERFCSDCATECADQCGSGSEGGAGGAGPSSTSSTTGSGSTASSSAGAGGAGGVGGEGGVPATDTPTSDADSSNDSTSCSCTAVGSRSTGLGGLLLLVAVGALASRRRRG
jgi:hypothetical protein